MKNRFTGRLGRLFFNAVTLESCSPGSVVMKIRNTTDAGTLRAAQPSRMTSFYNGQKPSICLGGFTLIELLVVVLIIGILSAIALPQYTAVVEKSRATEAVQNVATIEKQIELYIMENGVPSNSREVSFFDIASVQLGDCVVNDYSCDTKYFNYYVLMGGTDSGYVEVTRLFAEGGNYYSFISTREPNFANDDAPVGGWYRACITQSNDKGRKICKLFEGQGWKYTDTEI